MIKLGTYVTFKSPLTGKMMEGKLTRYVTTDRGVAEIKVGTQKYFCVSNEMERQGTKLDKSNPNAAFKRKER